MASLAYVVALAVVVALVAADENCSQYLEGSRDGRAVLVPATLMAPGQKDATIFVPDLCLPNEIIVGYFAHACDDAPPLFESGENRIFDVIRTGSLADSMEVYVTIFCKPFLPS